MKREPQSQVEDTHTKRHKNNSYIPTPIQSSLPDEPVEIVYAHKLRSSGEFQNEENSLLNGNILETLRSISNLHNHFMSAVSTPNSEPVTSNYSNGNRTRDYDNYSTHNNNKDRHSVSHSSRTSELSPNNTRYSNTTHTSSNRDTIYDKRRAERNLENNSNRSHSSITIDNKSFNNTTHSRSETKKYDDTSSRSQIGATSLNSNSSRNNDYNDNNSKTSNTHRNSSYRSTENPLPSKNNNLVPEAKIEPEKPEKPSSKIVFAQTYRDAYDPGEKEENLDFEEVKLREQSLLAEPQTFQERVKKGIETDPRRLEQRQKQIDFGKNTPGYAAYIKAVPRKERLHDDDRHPTTPKKHQECSKRSFDGQIKKWRRLLHVWDPNADIKLTAGGDYVDLGEIDDEMAELERLLNEKEKNLEEFST